MQWILRQRLTRVPPYTFDEPDGKRARIVATWSSLMSIYEDRTKYVDTATPKEIWGANKLTKGWFTPNWEREAKMKQRLGQYVKFNRTVFMKNDNWAVKPF